MATPGINPLVILDRLKQDEKTIVMNLSQEWYVTHGGNQIQLGPTSIYDYILMKPTNDYQQMFNIERELVVIFSPYENFEPRSLDAIDWAINEHRALRIERICSIMISRDNNIESKLRDLLKNDQESQIVVPFSYEELLSATDPYFMRNRIKSHFYSRDLFAFQAPLKKDLYFFGRSDLIHDIVNRHRSGENSGLFGLRKTGKTSVLYGVQRALALDDIKSVMIDCQNPAFHRRRWNKALHYIIQEARRQLKLQGKGKPEEAYEEENAPINFEAELLQIYSQVKHQSILFIFDEIENITFRVSPTEHWASGMDFIFFWQTLRSLFQKLNRVFTYTIVGTNPTCVETPAINGKDNPIFNQLPFQYIPRFDVPQTREMTTKLGRIMGISFDEIIHGKLTEDFGGHPFLMRHVCSTINRIAPTTRPTYVSKALYDQGKKQFIQENGNYIEMILNILREHYPDEYEMLRYLARGDDDTFKEFAAMSPYYTNHLLGYGIVESNHGLYSFRIEAIREYLANKDKYQKIKMTSQEMLAEISERRNLLEPRIRSIVRTSLGATYGIVTAKDMVLDVFGGERKSRYKCLSYAELFNPNKSKIYWEDLRKIIIKHWDCFKYIFGPDKGEFDSRMATINKYRADAHAKEIDIDQFQYFRVCARALEKLIDDFCD